LVVYGKKMDSSFHSNHSMNDKFITLAFLTDHADEVDIMDRKAITLDEDIIQTLNRKRLGGETWSDLFRQTVGYIPERSDWKRGAKND